MPCYQVPLPTLCCPEHAAITSKYAWARHHIQRNGSLLSTLQAPNNWFHYPITLNKKEEILPKNSAEDSPDTPWKNALGTSVEKNWAKVLSSLPTKLLFLSESVAFYYILLWVRHSHFSLAPCQDMQKINLLQFCVYKRKRHERIHNISWAHRHIIKVIINLPAFYQAMNHFTLTSPLRHQDSCAFWPRSISSVWPSSTMNNRECRKIGF